MKSDDKAGLYITVIFHLMVIIVLLVSQISSALKRENTFVLDFSKQERVEKEQAERNLKEEVSERLDRMLAAASGVPVRNVAVDRARSRTTATPMRRNSTRRPRNWRRNSRTVLILMSRTRTTPQSASQASQRRNLKSHLTKGHRLSLMNSMEGKPANCQFRHTDVWELVMSRSSSPWTLPARF